MGSDPLGPGPGKLILTILPADSHSPMTKLGKGRPGCRTNRPNYTSWFKRSWHCVSPKFGVRLVAHRPMVTERDRVLHLVSPSVLSLRNGRQEWLWRGKGTCPSSQTLPTGEGGTWHVSPGRRNGFSSVFGKLFLPIAGLRTNLFYSEHTERHTKTMYSFLH